MEQIFVMKTKLTDLNVGTLETSNYRKTIPLGIHIPSLCSPTYNEVDETDDRSFWENYLEKQEREIFIWW